MSTTPDIRYLLGDEAFELTQNVCDGDITPEQWMRLEELLREDERRLTGDLLLMGVEADLVDTFGTTEETETPKRASKRVLRISRTALRRAGERRVRAPRQRRNYVPLAAAAVLLLAVGLWSFDYFRRHAATEGGVAVVSALADAGFDTTPLVAGQDLAPGHRIRLTEGAAEIRFQNGAAAIVEAPATVSVISESAMRLHDGTVVCRAEVAGARGFTVQTASGNIRDLGTVFGVRTAEDGALDAVVFDGDVAWFGADGAANSSEVPVEVSEGEALRVAAGPAPSVNVGVASPVLLAGFPSSMAASACRPESLQGVRFFPGNGGDTALLLNQPEVRAEAVLVLESAVTALTKPLRVNIDRPGALQGRHYAVTSPLVPGQDVASYLLQARSVNRIGRFCEGRITFRQPILGIIVDTKQLLASDSMFSFVCEDPHSRGLETGNNRDTPDRLTLSKDRRTLTFKLRVNPGGVDHLRIITPAPPRLQKARRG